MATREKIKMDDYETWGLNVSETVGNGGKNQVGDVMMVQAMFRYLVMHDRAWVVGVKSMADLPEADGKFSNKFGRVIFNFQKKNDYLLVSVDGLIHPASNKGRNIKFVDEENSRLMTITMLHTEMWAAAGSSIDYTLDLLRVFPKLGIWIK